MREIDKPFVMPIEDTFSISGRGTVATGAIEKGSIKVGDDIEIVGLGQTIKTTCTGREICKEYFVYVAAYIQDDHPAITDRLDSYPNTVL